jgi:hypothetical protein
MKMKILRHVVVTLCLLFVLVEGQFFPSTDTSITSTTTTGATATTDNTNFGTVVDTSWLMPTTAPVFSTTDETVVSVPTEENPMTSINIDPTTNSLFPTTTTSGISSGLGSGSSSSSFSSEDPIKVKCNCREVRKISLTGASDYCLAPEIAIQNKCGNEKLMEKGECPRKGSEPCSSDGYVLTNDSLCLFDKKDDIYKCAASKEDLEIKKKGKRKKNNSSAMDLEENHAMSLMGAHGKKDLTLKIIFMTSVFFILGVAF